MKLPLIWALTLFIFFAPFQPSDSDQLRNEIEKLIKAGGAELVAVAVYDTQTKQTLLINEKTDFHAASTMKVPVMMEIFRLAEEKKIRLDDRIEVKNRFKSIVDGSEYSLKVDADSEGEVYKKIGKSMTVYELVDRMITWSSNLATNILIDKVKAENVNKLMRELGANDIQVRRGVEDTKAFEAGLNNTATAYDLMLLLKRIAENDFLGKTACDGMVKIMLAQHFNEGIPAGVPKGAQVAHKTGSITKHNHDAAIVYPQGKKPYVVVVLTRGIADHKLSSKLISDISSAIYKDLTKKREITKQTK